MKSKMLFVICALSIFGSALAYAEPESLYKRFDGQNVKIYVNEVVDSSQEKNLDKNDFKNQIKKALQERKSIHFEIVEAGSQANLQVGVDIQEFYWTDHDPVDMIMGAGAIAMDVAKVEDFARVQAEVSVVDTKTGKALWQDKLIATVTKKPMSKSESIPLVAEDFAKVFIKKCFGRQR